MNIEKYLEEMKNFQKIFLEFLENIENVEEKYQDLKTISENMKIRDNEHDLRFILRFISIIIDNYFHFPDFFIKIERTLQLFKDEIKKYYSNSEIFNIFKNNKRILLFLINNEIITVDESFIKTITTNEFAHKYYPEYFAPEIKQFWNKKPFPKEDLPDGFNEKREKGENESSLSKIIREDCIEDFIEFINKKCISLNATIKPSIYEANSFLLEKQNQKEKSITLIEYAAFFGSIQIFQYLINASVELTPSLMFYAIHGKNAEIICLLEEHNIESKNEEKGKFYKSCFLESIKCHHNDIAEYFINNYLHNEDKYSEETFIQSLEYFNISFLKAELMNDKSFYHLCNFDYYFVVKFLLACGEVDVNRTIIFKIISFNEILNLYFLMEFWFNIIL